jgi:hypothetical protein
MPFYEPIHGAQYTTILIDFDLRVADNRGMSDLTKILVSACVGMISGLAGGLALEPLRDFIRTSLKAGQARRGIRREIAELRDLFQSAMQQDDEFNMTLLPRVAFDAFDFYYTQYRDAFYKIKHSDDILGLYREMKLIQVTVATKKMSPSSRHETCATRLIVGLTLEFLQSRS